jgi:hypothetical protein
MAAQDVWTGFCEKLKNDALTEADFTEEMGPYLINWLRGADTLQRRTKFISAPVRFFDTGTKAVVMLACPDDDYRFDFVCENDVYKLVFMECITLPVNDITKLPYSDFIPLPRFESWIRREKEISKTVYLYNKFKELLGPEKAALIFLDGYGEAVNARSWVPFYSGRLAFIANAAWQENRISGESIVLEEFSEDRSVIRFKDHIWLRMYRETGHLRTQIPYDEYIGLFEAVWRDRAEKSGWKVGFAYEGEDTIMTFEKATD